MVTSYQLQASVVYFISFFSMGIILSNIGPVMPSLMARTNTAISAMGFIVAARSLGYLIGCASAGVSYDKFASRGHWLLSAGLIGAGVCNGIVPWVYNAIVLVVVFLVQGIFVGFIDTGCNVMLIRVHSKSVDAWMQTLHMCFGIGALTSPVLVRAVETHSSTSNFNCSFWIMAIFIIVNGVLPLFLASPRAENSKSAVESHMSKFGTAVLILTGSFLFLYVGTEGKCPMLF
jgi:MFS family permease